MAEFLNQVEPTRSSLPHLRNKFHVPGFTLSFRFVHRSIGVLDASRVELVALCGLAPERLVLEITESVALSDIDSAISVIEHLKSQGIALALDDFGTGYSSLSYLAKLRPKTIKIDRSFVSPVRSSIQARQLLEAMISLCHALDMTVLAEGIETEEQLELLRGLGCEFGQGYLFSPAVSADQVPEMGELALRNWKAGNPTSSRSPR